MDDFLRFFDKLTKHFPVHLEIGYNKTSDYCIYIYKKGCAEDYPNAKHFGNDVVLVLEQDSDIELCFAKAHVALKQWLMEFEGGY